MRISVIVPTRNRIESLGDCLNSIILQTVLPYEIIIVDSSDEDITLFDDFRLIVNRAKSLNIMFVYKHERPGLTHQRNVGASAACGDILFFFDDDVVLSSDYLEKILETFRQFPKYGGGMGTVHGVKKNFSINKFLRIIFLMQRNNSSGKFTFSGMPTHAYGKNKFCEVEALGGCCMCYRSEVFIKYIFDENLDAYAYMEDCDFSKRVSRDYKLFYNPQAVLEHRQTKLHSDQIVKNRAMFVRNYTYLFFKNFYPENRLRMVGYLWTVLGLFVEALVLIRSIDYIRGYIRGLREYYTRAL